jgi:hypothetical protein
MSGKKFLSKSRRKKERKKHPIGGEKNREEKRPDFSEGGMPRRPTKIFVVEKGVFSPKFRFLGFLKDFLR